jgi:effector-binding domain-containing protein
LTFPPINDTHIPNPKEEGTMRPLSILLSVLLAFSFLALGCEKKPEEPATPETESEAPAKAEEPAKEEPKTAEVKYDEAVEKILTPAIEAHGGLERLQAMKSANIDMQVTSQGMSFKGSYATIAGEHRKYLFTIFLPSGAEMRIGFGHDFCWKTMGKVLLPCSAEDERSPEECFIDLATELWPLRERKHEIAAGQEKVGDKTYDTLTVSKGEIKGVIYLDQETHHIARMSTMVKKEGKEVETVAACANYKEFCDGLKWATKVELTRGGKPFESYEFLDMRCEPVDESIFNKPEQVADGTVVEKETQAGTVACTKMKGPYKKSGKTIGKLMAFMMKQKLTPTGMPMMIYLKGPPKVKKPKKFVTEICFPVATKAPKKPKKKGKFVIKAMKPKKVLAAYGVGPYETKAPELMKLLIDEAKKRELKTTGPMRQISFMDPKETAAEELVSEMQIPIK